MKNILLILLTMLMLGSCGSSGDDSKTTKTMNPNDIRISEVRHDSLSSEQIAKIKIIQSTFEEPYPMSLEETITNFKRDVNPDSEIAIWLQMANAYKTYVNSKQGKLNLAAKKEIFSLILSRSMMPAHEAIKSTTLTVLTEKDAQEVLSYYTATPDPIDVVTKP